MDFMPLVFSLLLSAGMMPFLIPYLRKLKFGQTIREDGPTWHSA